MIALLLGRRPSRAAAPAPQEPAPLSPGEVHAAVSEASLHLDQAGHTLAAAHTALDTYWDSLREDDQTAAHQAGSDVIRAIGRAQSALAAIREDDTP